MAPVRHALTVPLWNWHPPVAVMGPWPTTCPPYSTVRTLTVVAVVKTSKAAGVSMLSTSEPWTVSELPAVRLPPAPSESVPPVTLIGPPVRPFFRVSFPWPVLVSARVAEDADGVVEGDVETVGVQRAVAAEDDRTGRQIEGREELERAAAEVCVAGRAQIGDAGGGQDAALNGRVAKVGVGGREDDGAAGELRQAACAAEWAEMARR